MKNICGWMLMLVGTLGLMWAGGVQAGSLTPPGAPGATMHTLEEIYQHLLATQQQVAGLEQQLIDSGIMVPAGMVLIPVGDFVMGDTFSEGTQLEIPLHTNTISAFYMDRTVVTKAEWDEVHDWAATNGYTFANVGEGKAADHPVQMVNWYDCVKWANARSEKEGLTPCYLAEASTGTVYRTGELDPICDWYANGYRLPTEAEWEKAARGGAPGTRFSWTGVNTIQHLRANYYAEPSLTSYDTNATTGGHPDYDDSEMPYTSPVGSFAPNGYGLYDMVGNVAEWCWDWFSDTYYASSPRVDPRGPGSGSLRMRRSSSWADFPSRSRVAKRSYHLPDNKEFSVGFRLVRTAP